jgi:magnesium transporter
VIVDCAIYEHGRRRDGDTALEQAYDASGAPDTFVWIGLAEPTPDEFDSIRSEFHLHPLAVEDAIESHQRPKLEVFDDMVFLVLKTVRYVDPDEVVEVGEIMVFLGADFLITVRHGEGSPLDGVRKGLEDDPKLLAHGPGAVLHAIVDRVVDDYGPAIAGLETDVEQVEEQVFTSARRANPAERIYKLKREVLQFLRAATPLIDPIERLSRGHYSQIHPEITAYFRDVNDHLVRARDQLEGLNDLLSNVLQANLTQIGIRQNEDMRKISAWVAIAAVPTMIAGIYGMNFEDMPELTWEWGYPAVIALMASICSFLYWRFRRAGWL